MRLDALAHALQCPASGWFDIQRKDIPMTEAAAAATQGAATMAPAPQGLSVKMVIMICAGLLLVGIGGTVAVLKFMGGAHQEASRSEPSAAVAATPSHGAGGKGGAAAANAPGAIADLESFVVNLADTPEVRYLKVTMKLEVERPELVEEIKARIHQVRDPILILLSSKEAETLRGAQGKLQLRDEIRQRINAVLPNGGVRTVYFTEFVVQ
jgi:flagellar FliL protein